MKPDKDKNEERDIKAAKNIKVGAGIADEDIRKNLRNIHGGANSGGIDDNETEDTFQKGFDRTED